MSFQKDFFARNVVGKPCGLCSCRIEKMDMVYIGQIHGRVYHQDCYEIVEKHQARHGLLETKTITKSQYEESVHNPKLRFDDPLWRK